jgi:predicted permease
LIHVRDWLLVAQIAICAVLVTASMVALRGLVRTVNGHFGFDTSNAMLANTDLDMAGYHGDALKAMQKRMVESIAGIPGVTSVALTDWVPLGNGGGSTFPVFADDSADLNPANAAAKSMMFSVSPGYLRAAGTVLLSGRDFTANDDEGAASVAMINDELARKVFGSAQAALGRHYKLKDGTRLQVIGIVENGKYGTVTEDQQAATFVPLLQAPSSSTWMIARTTGDLAQLGAAMNARVRELDRGLPVFMQTWEQSMSFPLFPSRVATASLGVLGMMGAMLSITGIFGMAAYSVSRRLRELGIRIALGARKPEILSAALGRAFKLLAIGSTAGLALGILASRVLSFVVYQATPRDPVVLGGVVAAMTLLGLLATWIPARRALSIDPLILLREE